MTDYHDFTTKSTTRAERARLHVGDIWVNAATCRRCWDYIRSCNRHDLKSCSCGTISVDGGSFYVKRSGDPLYCENDIQFFDDIEQEKEVM